MINDKVLGKDEAYIIILRQEVCGCGGREESYLLIVTLSLMRWHQSRREVCSLILTADCGQHFVCVRIKKCENEPILH